MKYKVSEQVANLNAMIVFMVIGCIACDDSSAPVHVDRIVKMIKSIRPELSEIQRVGVYTEMLKTGVLAELHSSSVLAITSGASEHEARAEVDCFLTDMLGPVVAEKESAGVYDDDWALDESSSDEEEEFASSMFESQDDETEEWMSPSFEEYDDDF